MAAKDGVPVVLTEVEYVVFRGSARNAPGEYFDDEVQLTDGLSLEEIAKNWLPRGTTSLQSFKRLEGQVEVDGEAVKMESQCYGRSDLLYLRDTIETREEVAAREFSDNLLYWMDDMWHCSAVIKQGPYGQWLPFSPERGDRVIEL